MRLVHRAAQDTRFALRSPEASLSGECYLTFPPLAKEMTVVLPSDLASDYPRMVGHRRHAPVKASACIFGEPTTADCNVIRMYKSYVPILCCQFNPNCSGGSSNS